MKKFIIGLCMLCIPTFSLADVNSGSNSAAQSVLMNQTKYEASHLLPQAIPLYPNYLQQVPGMIADVTNEIPAIVGLQPLKTEKVVREKDSVRVKYGWFGDRVRLEDVERDLIDFWIQIATETGWKEEEMRYRVQMKQNYRSVGTGGGVVASGNAVSSGGLSGGSGSVGILPGFNSTLTDPHFIIKIYHVFVPDWEFDVSSKEWRKN